MNPKLLRILFNSRWDENNRNYRNFHLVHVLLNTSFNQLIYIIQSNLFPSFEYLISRITLYRDGCNNPNVVTIVEDKDVLWLLFLISGSSSDHVSVVFDHFPSCSSNFPILGSSSHYEKPWTFLTQNGIERQYIGTEAFPRCRFSTSGKAKHNI